MAEYKVILPSMGEGVMEATIINWLKSEGELIQEDESIVEIATDKVDSEVPSPKGGKIIKLLKQVNEIAKIGETIAILEIEGEEIETATNNIQEDKEIIPEPIIQKELEKPLQTPTENLQNSSGKYLSPLIKSIAKQENISSDELQQIQGSGAEGRITKDDIFAFLKQRTQPQKIEPQPQIKSIANSAIQTVNTEIIAMDRMRKLIAENMVNSKRIAPHVTSFIETDVTNVVHWRNKNKDIFQKREGEKLTFMPIFVWAVAKAIKDFPMINVSVDGDTIIKKKDINIGMATALPSGNLIVPVIKNADQYNISGLAKAINDLANRARNNKLKPTEIQNGTYTITNLGTFGNIMGTPIINQPQVAILAVGAIEKKPSVIETPQGDLIGIRHKMFMSHAYDHRVVDGALGGMFLQRVHQYLQNFDISIQI